jgi:tRNA(Ile2) C34 agmatinyltransferase TiaS
MSCPTCDHTMHSVGDTAWWCPRCGTLSFKGFSQIETPKLVTRCRELSSRHLLDKLQARSDWHTLGIGESIFPPDTRAGAVKTPEASP